jgi:hypothetical protein
MTGTMQKLKEKITHPRHHHHHDNTAAGYGAGYTDATAGTTYGTQPAAAVVVQQTEAIIPGQAAYAQPVAQEGMYAQQGGYAQQSTNEVVNAREFTEVEDRPILKERVERIIEHQPVEKHFVTETRAVGEHALQNRTVESAGMTERVIGGAETRPMGYNETTSYDERQERYSDARGI